MASIIGINLFKLLTIFLVAYIGGLFVKHKKIKVNYTRKINHFFLFFMPALVDRFCAGLDPSPFAINEFVFFFGSFIIFIKPIRERVWPIGIAFSSFDRPEDRPYTLLWYVMQEFFGYLVMVPAIEIYERYNMLNLLAIPILISALGDGLAEPVGVRFGKYRYLTYAIFCKKRYCRTIEGSLMVFAASVLIVFYFRHAFSIPQFIAAMLTIPVIATLSEALAPHTLDNPIIVSACLINVFLIKHFI